LIIAEIPRTREGTAGIALLGEDAAERGYCSRVVSFEGIDALKFMEEGGDVAHARSFQSPLELATHWRR